MTQLQDVHGNWIYLIPVTGLLLTKAVKNEIKINRVTFISLAKLARVRRRFGIRDRLSIIKKTSIASRFFENSSPTIAVMRHNGTIANTHTKVLRLVSEELELIAASQLGYSKRRYNSRLSVFSQNYPSLSWLCLNSTNKSCYQANSIIGQIGELALDERWLQWQKKFFFYTFINILNGKIELQNNWKSNLYRVVKLAGQSLLTQNLSQAFLLNMIAIESLLTRQGDKYSEELPRRIEAFFGWLGYWDLNGYEDRILNIYKKRCQYVHDGNESNIQIDDLLFTDDLLMNLLNNIILHHKIFSNKDDIISFADKVSAEHTLGIVGEKSKVRPKTLSFLRKQYNEEDYLHM